MARFGLLTLLLAAAPAGAQDVLGTPADSSVLSAVDRSSAPPAEVTPLSLALSLAFLVYVKIRRLL
jgi:hypothetical protein